MTTSNLRLDHDANQHTILFGSDYLGHQVFKKFEPVIEDYSCPQKTQDWKKNNDRSINETIAIYCGNQRNGSIKKLMKEVKTIGGDSGKKNKSATMTDADIACYSSRYSDIKDKPAKDHFRTVGDL